MTTKPQADYKELRDSRDSTLLIFCVVAFAKIEVLKIENGKSERWKFRLLSSAVNS